MQSSQQSYNRRTRIYFNTKQEREDAIEFLLKLNLTFTYVRAFPFIDVKAKDFIKHHLDLYLSGIKICVCKFQYRTIKTNNHETA